MENQEKTQKDQENLNQIENDMEAQIEGILGKDQENSDKNKNENDQDKKPDGVALSMVAPSDLLKSLCSFPEVVAFNASTKNFSEPEKKAVRGFFKPSDDLLENRIQVGGILLKKYFPSMDGDISPELAALMVFVVPPVFAVVQAYQYKSESDRVTVEAKKAGNE